MCDLPQLPSLEGSSFASLLNDPTRQWKSAAFSQYTRGETRGYSMRTVDHRYTEWREIESQEITARELYEYDDSLYPVEPANLADARPELVEKLSGQLAVGHGWKYVRAELPTSEPADFSIARVFADHMVLPRDRSVPVWGTAPPGTQINVAIHKQSHHTIAGGDGRWQIRLDPLAASTEPTQLRVNDRVIRDVLVGDVWLCSGQSNMRWMLRQSRDADAEVAAAGDVEHLRLLDLTAAVYPTRRAYEQELLRNTTPANYFAWSGWQRAAPESAATFSAVAWHFGRRMVEQRREIPIGLIHNAIGGTPMESWIPERTLLGDPQLQQLVTTGVDHGESPAVSPLVWCPRTGEPCRLLCCRGRSDSESPVQAGIPV